MGRAGRWTVAVTTLVLLAASVAAPAATQAANLQVVSGRYIGNGATSRPVTGLGFKPDLVIIKARNAAPPVVRTTDMTGDASKELGTAVRLRTSRIRSLDASGFTVGNDAAANAPGVTYHWTAFRAAAGQMALGVYTGTGVSGLSVSAGFKPDYLMILGDEAAQAMQRFASEPGDSSLSFAGSGELTDRITQLTSTGFKVGASAEVNRAGSSYYWVGWKVANGLIATGAYAGTGLDGRDITGLGMRPYVMILASRQAGVSTVQRTASVSGDSTLPAYPDTAFADGIQSVGADGFQVGRDARVNAASANYAWAAFQNGGGVDLDLDQSADRPSPNEGDTLTLSARVTNFGPANTSGVLVADRLPAGLSYVGHTASLGTYDPATGVWNLNNLAAAATATLDLRARVDAGTGGQTMTSIAAVTASSQADYYAGNDADTVRVAIPLADLDVHITTDDYTPTETATLDYAIRVANHGPSESDLVALQVVPAPGLSFVNATASQGVWDAGSGTWAVGTVAAGDSATLTLTALANPGSAGATLNTLVRVASSEQADHGAANDRDSIDVRVMPSRFRVMTGSYVGNGTAGRAITGVGFQPDLLILKGANAGASVARTKLMSGDAAKELGAATALLTGRIRSLDRDGFTVGAEPSVNEAGTTYYWTAFLEAPGQMKVGTYTGDGLDNRNLTGLGFQPGYAIVLGATTQTAAQRFAAEVGDLSLPFTAVAEQADRIQAFQADGFQIGKNADVNAAGVTYHYIAWGMASGLIGGGAYLGDGTDDRTLTTPGFRPHLLLISRSAGITMARNRSMAGDLAFPVASGAPLANAIQALAPYGFQIGSDASVNTASKTFFYAAFRDGTGADLGVATTVDRPAPSEGNTVAYTVTLNNYGPQDAAGVEVTDHLPAGLTYLSNTASPGSYDPASGRWTVGGLANAAAASLTLTARVNAGTAGTTLTDLAQVTASNAADLIAADNADSVAVTVQSADLEVVNTVDDATPTENETTTFTVQVINHGPFAATGISVVDLVPAGLAYLSATPSQGSYTAGTGVWTVGSVAVGSTASLALRTAPVAGTVGSTITTTARAQGLDPIDPVPANDASTVGVTVQRSEFRVMTGSYVGNGTAGRAITGVGFQPDLLILKGANAGASVARTKLMSGDAAKELGAATALLTGRIRSLDRDGFTVGAEPSVNEAGTTYYWTAFLEAAGQMKVGAYTGDGLDNRNLTGLGFQPGYAMVLSASTQPAVQRFAAEVGDASLPFTAVAEQTDRIQAFQADGFQIGKNGNVNAAGVTHYYVAWSASSSRVKGGIYLGNGADDRPITGVGFRPRHLLVKRQDTAPAVWRTGSVNGDLTLPTLPLAPYANGTQAFLSDGFELGTDAAVNTSGKVYFWSSFRDVASMDLAVTATVSDSTPNERDLVTYTIRVRNLGPENATGVAVQDTLPGGVTYQTYVPSRGVYDPATGIWTLGSVVSGDSATLAIAAVVDTGTTGRAITNLASLSALDQTDSNNSDDQGSATIRVQASDLALRMEADHLSPRETDPVAFTLTVVNRGPDAATGITVRDSLPAGLDFVSATPSRGAYLPPATWSLGSLAAGDSATLTVRTTVALGTGGTTITHHAAIQGSDQADPRAGDRTDSATVYVALAPGIQVTAAQPTVTEWPGTQTVRLMTLTVLNSSAAASRLDRLVLSNRTAGSGTPAELDAELGDVRLYRDDGDGSFAPSADSLLAHARAGGGAVTFDTLGVSVPAGSLVRLHLVLDVPLTARDGDMLDLGIDGESDVVFDQVVTFLNPWPVNPAGGVTVDGMAAVQITVRAHPDSLISVGAVRVLALDATLPPNGYEPDVLKGVSLVNRGDAAPSVDLRRVELWGDGGDGVFDAGSGDDFPLGVTAWNGSAWTVSGLFIPIPVGGRRIFASADVADSAGIGRKIELGFEGPGTTGVDVSSGNDGPLDAAVAGSRVITIGPGPSRIVAAASPQTAGVLLPGESGITVFQFSLQNLSAQPETLTSVTFQNTSSGPGTPSERDAEWLPLSLRLETDPIATSSFSGGRAVCGGLTVTLGPGTTTRFQVASGASLKARDGDLLDVSIPGAPDLIFSKGVLLTGAWPLAPDGSFTVDGMSLAQITVAGQATPDLLTGSARNNALDVVIPANGYQTDTLQFLVVQNHGDAQPLLDIPRVEAWADDGDGVFEPDPASGTGDRLLGPLYFIGGVWALGGFSLPVPPGGQRVFISCDVARDATESRTVRFSLPASPIVGLGMASSNDGPRDGELLNPVTMTISTIDRMTFTTQNIAAGSAAPGDTQIVLAHLVGRNTYADSTKTLTGLTLTNLTRTAAVASQSELDGEVQSLKLRADAPNGPVLATGYFLVGRAAFSGFSWSVPPGASRDLYVTGDLSSTAATDGDVIGAAVNVESALQFADFTSLSARFPLNSGAAWTVDGMTADQIVNWGAPAVSLSPDDVPTLALDWTVPRNGYRDDVLEGVRLANDGTATAADLRELHLWKDGGDGTFDRGTGDDVDLGAMSFIAGRWSSATLSEPLGRAGVRLFASVAPSSAAADSASVRLVIPIGGLTVTSANDGPTDRPIANPGALLMSTSHLLASLVMGASVSVVGDAVTAHMTVRNLGLQAITAITPSALRASGDGWLSLVGGPTPASLDLAPGTEGTFDWTLRADSTGTTTLSADASGFELGTGTLNQTLPASTSQHQIFARADSLLLYSTESMPFSVNRGQTGVVPLTLTFTHPGGSTVSDILLRSFSIRLENEAGDPVVPRSLLARVGANEGTSVYAELRALPESGSRIDLTLSPPVRVRGGGGTGAQASLRLSLDILDTTRVASFRVFIPDDSSFVAEDAISGSPVRIALDREQPYPLLSGLTRIVAAATELDVAVVPDAARTAARGQSAVTLLTVQATNPGPVGLGPEIRLSTFGVTLVDSTRTPLARPSRVLKRIRVTAGTQLVTDRSLTAGDDTLITLDLSPDLTLALNTPVTISIAADIADSADVGVVRLRLADSTTFEVRNTNTGTLLPTIQQAPPIEGHAVAVVARSDSLRARAVPGLPPSLTVGSTGVLAMTVLLSHAGSAWTGTITLGQLMVRCRDQLSNTLPPAAFVDRARVLLRGVEVGLVTNFPSTRDAFALPLSGVTLAPGEQVSLQLYVDLQATAPAGLFQMTIGGPDILAHDANLGTPVAAGPDIGAEFPLSSGITTLEAPARDLAVGFEDRMPAVLVADGAEIPVARLALRNTSPNGQIRLDHLVLLAADPALTAIALGDAVSRVRAYTADTLWADTGDLPLGTTAGLLTAATTLVLPGGAPVPIELRITLRPGAPFDGLRVGCRADGIGVVQPGSPLLAVAVAAENGQSFPFWTQAASAGATTLTDSYANFPNPFAAGRQTSRFVYYLRGDARVRLDLWTTRGDRVKTLLDDAPMARGLHQDVTWDGRNERGTVVVNGAYLAEIRVRYQDGSTERMLRKVAVVR